jgi:uncharacterized protein (UPF0335 family)
MNLTDNEIIKALECCNKPIGQAECKKCSYFETENSCAEKLINDTVDLINRQKAEIERLHEVINGFEEQSHKELLKFVDLSEKYTDAKAEIKKLQSKIERLQSEKAKLHKLIPKMIKEAKSEAIKEFQHKSESILIELYEEYHRIANKPNNAWFKRFTKEENEMFYQGRAEAIWECITTNRNLVKEMVGEE